MPPGRRALLRYAAGAAADLPKLRAAPHSRCADNGDSGAFRPLGWKRWPERGLRFYRGRGRLSSGAALSGVHWARSDDRLGPCVVEGRAGPQRDYPAAADLAFLSATGSTTTARNRSSRVKRTQWSWREARTSSIENVSGLLAIARQRAVDDTGQRRTEQRGDPEQPQLR
jgi:hypothetical protein